MPAPEPADEQAFLEGAVLVTILLLVGGFAGAASFTHVKEWTLANSPHGTPEWFGWGNAVISELVPVAAALEIRRRRRRRMPVGYPLALLAAAACLSLAAQIAVAKPGFTGGLLSAVPALAFMALAKLALSAPGATPQRELAPTPVAPTKPASALAAPAPALQWVDRAGRAPLRIVARHPAPRAIPTLTIPAPVRATDSAPPAPSRQNGAPVDRANGRATALLARPATPLARRATNAKTPARHDVDQRRATIRDYRRANPGAGARAISAALGIPDRTVSRDLAHLDEETQ